MEKEAHQGVPEWPEKVSRRSPVCACHTCTRRKGAGGTGAVGSTDASPPEHLGSAEHGRKTMDTKRCPAELLWRKGAALRECYFHLAFSWCRTLRLLSAEQDTR